MQPERCEASSDDEAVADRADEVVLGVVVEQRADTAVVRVAGEVDAATVPQLAAAIETALATGTARVVLDLQDVGFIDCAGLKALDDGVRQARDQAVRLQVVPGRALTRLSALLGSAAARRVDGGQ
jgi:anti-sigma B factor antagonist